jgi:hypothetical protein
VRYYASGYYYAAKRQRREQPVQLMPVLASGAPPKIIARPVETTKTPADANAMQVPAQ